MNVVGIIFDINQCSFCFAHFFSILKSSIYVVFLSLIVSSAL